MAMKYEARQVGDVTILDISGRIDVGVALEFGAGGTLSLQHVVRDLANRGHKKILLNLHDVAYIDSSGIGDLVGSATTVRKQGGDLRVVNPNLVVRDLLRLTRIDTVIDVKPDETSAVEAFQKATGSGAADH